MPEENKSSLPADSQPVNQTAAQPVLVKAKGDKKPLIIALVLGGVVLFAIILFFVFNNKPQPEPSIPISEVPKTLKLELTSPKDGELALEDEILITGTTNIKSTVAIYTEGDEVIVETDEAGNFETTVKLVPGINSLNIKAFTDDGQETSTNMDLVYDSET